MTVRELVTRWGFDIDDKPLKQIDQSIGTLKNTITVVGGAAIAGAATIFGFAKSTSSAGDEIAKNSKALGVGADAYQRYRYAAELAGIEQGTFQIGLRTFVRQLGDASSGTGEGARIFQELGISIKGANGQARKSEDVMADLANRFQNMPDQAQKAAIATKLFGREGAKMTLMLNGGAAALQASMAEASEFGNVLDGETLAASELLNDQLTQLTMIIKGFKNTLGAAFMPVVSDVIEAIKAWNRANGAIMRQKIKAWAMGFYKVVKTLVGGIMVAWNALQRWLEVLYKLRGILKVVAIAMGAFIALRAAHALGSLAVGTFQAAKGFITLAKGINKATMTLWLQVAAIGAIIALVFLIIDDVLTYMEDGDSLLGRALIALDEMWQSIIDKMQKAWDDFVEGIVNDPKVQKVMRAMEWAGGKVDSVKEFLPKWAGGKKSGGQVVNQDVQITIPGSSDPVATGNAVKNALEGAIEDAAAVTVGAGAE